LVTRPRASGSGAWDAEAASAFAHVPGDGSLQVGARSSGKEKVVRRATASGSPIAVTDSRLRPIARGAIEPGRL